MADSGVRPFCDVFGEWILQRCWWRCRRAHLGACRRDERLDLAGHPCHHDDEERRRRKKKRHDRNSKTMWEKERAQTLRWRGWRGEAALSR